MVKKAVRMTLVLALAACWLLVPRVVPAASAGSFKDTGSHWSGQAVEKSYALGLMRGYPGNVFKPEDPVTRLEAIATIISAMGLEDRAKSLDWKNSGIRLPQGMFWGQGHLVLAVQKGLLDKNHVYNLLYDQPIPRQEVATLVAVALRDKLKEKGDIEKLTYSDSAQISPEYKQYVADVTRNNIMQGISDNEFGPHEVMKRGQMAALMVKIVQDGWFEYGAGKIITGNLSAIDSASGLITVTRADGTPVPRLADAQTVVYRDSRASSLDAFKVGDRVLMIAGSDARIKYLESDGDAAPTWNGNTAYNETTSGEVTGVFSSYFTVKTSSGSERRFSAKAGELKLARGGVLLPYTDLKAGDRVKVISVSGEAREITLLDSEDYIEAQVRTVDYFYYMITLLEDNGRRKEYEVKLGAPIRKGNDTVRLDELKQGDRVRFKLGSDGKITEISATGEGVRGVSGKVTDLRPGSSPRIYVDSHRYYIADNARITRDGDRIDLEDIMIGAEVSLELDDDDTAVEIEVTDDEDITVEGTVTDVDEDDGKITIEQSNGLEFTLRVSSSCTFYDQTSSSSGISDLDDIRRGWEVRLYLDNGRVRSIRVTDR
ncbi:MAG: S-layer homology domain-containing protein [Peptococcaceae bacterium]|nr:S-layer homology domain-containing protein [Peptococcaceae bacterium]